jgi:carbamoyltransferase
MKPFRLKKNTEVDFIGHHLSHASSAYFTSARPRNEKVLVATVDGEGDGLSCAIWRGQDGKLELLSPVQSSGSIGWFYSNVTEALGWWHGDGEGKTMGLAPYGTASNAAGVFDGFYPEFEDGELKKPYDFGPPRQIEIAGGTHYHLRDASRFVELTAKYRREDLAAEAQQILERQVMRFVLPWLKREQTTSLACAGGVFLNVKLNQRIWYSGEVGNHWVYPNSGDSGLAVGAALAGYYRRNPSAELHRLTDLYHGVEYSPETIERTLKERNLSYTRPENLVDEIATALNQNSIVGWFQGRMESGPRALGNRSILMSANRRENKDTINARVKFREAFRPFCPSITAESRDTYLRAARDEEFMITSFDVTKEKHDAVPAVVHVDGTLRPQMVRKSVNPLYHALISRFSELSGESLLLNTSLNVMGEPMICTPNEAIRCFYDSGIDVLALGPFVLRKRS